MAGRLARGLEPVLQRKEHVVPTVLDDQQVLGVFRDRIGHAVPPDEVAVRQLGALLKNLPGSIP